MDIGALINEKIQRLQDLNRQMGDISKQIGALQEQGRALHGAALEIKGAIDALADLNAKEEKKLAESKTAQLTLPAGVKPIVAEEAPTATPPAQEAIATPVTLEVQ